MRQVTTITEWYVVNGEAMPAHLFPAACGHAPSAAPGSAHAGVSVSLGSARASGVWGWSSAAQPHPLAPRPATDQPISTQRTELAMPAALMRAMAGAAARTGRPARDIWAEAAREWLQHHRPDDGPEPPTPCASAPRASIAPNTARQRTWSAIDILLSDLRAPRHLPPRPREFPAA